MRIDCKKLAYARKKKRIPINNAANRLGIPPILLGCVESGRRPLSSNSELAKNLLELYEVNLEDVI